MKPKLLSNDTINESGDSRTADGLHSLSACRKVYVSLLPRWGQRQTTPHLVVKMCRFLFFEEAEMTGFKN